MWEGTSRHDKYIFIEKGMSLTSPKKLAILCIVRYGDVSNNKLGVTSANEEVYCYCLGKPPRSLEVLATMMEINHHKWPKKQEDIEEKWTDI